MQVNEYVRNAVVTESPINVELISRMCNPSTIRLEHSAYGMCTEAAEFLDALKKHIFYGKPLDKVNLAEEIGDIMWYIAIAVDELGVNLEDIMQNNIDKLKSRYPDKFSEYYALNRNLSEERKILEQVGLDKAVESSV